LFGPESLSVIDDPGTAASGELQGGGPGPLNLQAYDTGRVKREDPLLQQALGVALQAAECPGVHEADDPAAFECDVALAS
jgi:hypothetical protein